MIMEKAQLAVGSAQVSLVLESDPVLVLYSGKWGVSMEATFFLRGVLYKGGTVRSCFEWKPYMLSTGLIL